MVTTDPTECPFLSLFRGLIEGLLRAVIVKHIQGLGSNQVLTPRHFAFSPARALSTKAIPRAGVIRRVNAMALKPDSFASLSNRNR
jgi:hypothetical protein